MSNKKLNAVITIGGALSGSFKSVMNTTKGELNKIGSEVNRLKKTQNQLGDSIKTFGGMGKNVDNLRSRYSAVTVELKKLESQQRKLNTIEKARLENNEKLSNLKGQLGSVIASTVTVGVPVKLAIDFESAMADVKKTFSGTDQEFKKISDDALMLSTRLPMVATEISKIMAAGSQSGIKANELTRFAEDAVKMGVAFDTTADIAGQSMAEMRTAFRMNQDEVVELADKINYLGNNTPAAAKAIMDIVQRIGPLGEVGGFASGSIAALGATLRGMGISEEIAATGIKNTMLALVAGESATKSQKAAYAELGLDYKRISKQMQIDANGTTLEVLKSVSKLEKHKQAAILSNLFGKESLGAIAPLLTNIESLEKNLGMVADKSKYAGSMAAEYQARSETTANSIILFKNSLSALGTIIGSVLLPYITAGVEKLGTFVVKVIEWSKANPELTSTIVKVVVGLTALKVGFIAVRLVSLLLRSSILGLAGSFIRLLGSGSGLSKVFKGAGQAILGMKNPLVIARAAFSSFGPVLKQIGFALLRTPWGAVAAVAIGTGIAIYKNWDRIKAFFAGFWQGLKQGMEPFTSAVSELIASVPILGKAWDLVSTAVSKAWNWFKELLTPVKASKEDIEKATSAGQRFGQLVGGAINAVLAPLRMMIDGFKRILDFGGKVFDLIGKIVGFDLGSKVAEVKSISQIPLAQPTPPKTTALPFPMKVPKVEMPKASFVGEGFAKKSNFEADNIPEAIKPFSSSKTSDSSQPARINQSDRREQVNHNSFSFTIHAVPNQNPKEIAQEVMQMLKQKQGIEERNSMIDWGYAQ
ncbi:phage tail tape measure protein [Acinetobacter bereziniae]|uniref:phage tail tape measure protein n=1 Tax=Acinetobacter bereziniae TaxID=106648 RepID=UPI001902A558|nr:phage tail tape measure protein [Acinetobacter bereziniae]MBJ9947771.1 phage tail tape measure protein [Acinetobacter bereziniae]